MRAKRAGAGGFTLLETIVTLVVLAFVGSMGAMAISDTNAKVFMARASLDDAERLRACQERLAGLFEQQLRDTDNTADGSATAALKQILDKNPACCGGEINVSVAPRTVDLDTGDLKQDSAGKLLEVTMTRGAMRLTHVFGD